MADGHLNICKLCTCKRVTKHRDANVERIREYDKDRPVRNGTLKAIEAWDTKYPMKRKAITTVGNAIRDGKITKKPCEVCGATKVHAHHDDYDKPLDVRFLCSVHHRAWHKKHGEAANGK